MPIDCITFDLDDTLWDCGPVMVRAEMRFYAWLASRCPRIAARYPPEALAAQRQAHYAEHPDRRHDLTHMRKRWLAELLRAFDYPADLAEPGFRVFWEGRNAVEVFDDVPHVLGRLRSRYTLGAITNGNADVHHIGIGHLFDFVVTAADAGAAKPEAVIFEAAIASAGAPAERVVHVGDDPARDVLGAFAVGMRAVWVNPRLEPWPGGRAPDAVVRGVGELVEVLAAW